MLALFAAGDTSAVGSFVCVNTQNQAYPGQCANPGVIPVDNNWSRTVTAVCPSGTVLIGGYMNATRNDIMTNSLD